MNKSTFIDNKVVLKISVSGNSLAVQWLGLGAFTVEGLVQSLVG